MTPANVRLRSVMIEIVISEASADGDMNRVGAQIPLVALATLPMSRGAVIHPAEVATVKPVKAGDEVIIAFDKHPKRGVRYEIDFITAAE